MTNDLDQLIDIAAAARRAYPRGGFAGVSTTELQVLLAIAAGAERAPEIAERLALDPSTARHALRGLAAGPLLRPDRDASGRRRIQYRLTAKGQEVVRRFRGSVAEEGSGSAERA